MMEKKVVDLDEIISDGTVDFTAEDLSGEFIEPMLILCK